MPLIVGPSGLGGTTALQLLQELGSRMGDYADGTVSANGADLYHLDDNSRVEPDNAFRLGWLTYTGSVATQNRGLERRITSYDGTVNVGRFGVGNGNGNSGLAVVAQPGDSYEVHQRWSRKIKLRALNQAIRRLPQDFWRRFEDTSIITAERTWAYALPTGMTDVFDVQIQVSLTMSGSGALATGSSGTGFPFQRVGGWSVRTNVDTGGTVSRVLQFDAAPPWPRVLRIVGKGYQPVLVSDTDTLAVGQDDYDQRLYEYVLSYAEAYLWLIGADGAPMDQAQRSVAMVKLDLQMCESMKPSLVMPQPAMEIESPYTGDGTFRPGGWGDNPRYMGALHTPNSLGQS